MKALEIGHKARLMFKISPIRSADITCCIKWIEKDRIGLIFPDDAQEFAQYLYEGKELNVIAHTNFGIYNFDSVVIDSPFNHDFVIEFPEENTKIQRRGYVRMSLKLELMLEHSGTKIKTETINVSGGGIRFKIDKELFPTEIWRFNIYLPKWKEYAQGLGEVLYNIKQNKKVISVIKFTDIHETYRNKLIKMCFEEELNKLQLKNTVNE
ncbi:MAG: PilZ domain-containing protein [Candidatus Gastranaerophilales bacterium]|nr:PilZ domain-containing protein [Candidatus Gastranaerophilales bacterium]